MDISDTVVCILGGAITGWSVSEGLRLWRRSVEAQCESECRSLPIGWEHDRTDAYAADEYTAFLSCDMHDIRGSGSTPEAAFHDAAVKAWALQRARNEVTNDPNK